MAAFYRLPRCLFYRVERFQRARFTIVFMRPPVPSEIKKVVYRMSEILLAAQITFRCLDGCMAQQELSLLQLSSAVMTQLGAGPPQVVGCDVLQARSPTAGPDHVPHNIREMPFPHTFPALATARKILSSFQ